MWGGKDIVGYSTLGSQKTSFQMIPALIDRIKETDLGCVAHSFDVLWMTSPFYVEH